MLCFVGTEKPASKIFFRKISLKSQKSRRRLQSEVSNRRGSLLKFLKNLKSFTILHTLKRINEKTKSNKQLLPLIKTSEFAKIAFPFKF